MAKLEFFQKTIPSSDFQKSGLSVVANVTIPVGNEIMSTPAVALQAFRVSYGEDDHNVLVFGAEVGNVQGVGTKEVQCDVTLTLGDNDNNSADPADCNAIIAGVVQVEGESPAGEMMKKGDTYDGTSQSAARSVEFERRILEDKAIGALQVFDISFASDGGASEDHQIRFIEAGIENLNTFDKTLTFDIAGRMEEEPSLGHANSSDHLYLRSGLLAEIAAE